MESCGDVLRNDLVFSTKAKFLHPILDGKMEQVLILNFLDGKDLRNVSKALHGGSTVMTTDTLFEHGMRAAAEFLDKKSNNFRGAIASDDLFDEMFSQLGFDAFNILRTMYDEGCSIIVAATMGIFTVPEQLSDIFEFEPPWRLTAYTSRSITMAALGKEILGNAFHVKEQYVKSHFIRAPPNESLFVEYVNSNDYDDSSEEEPEPNTDSPIVVHRGPNGGCLSYFGFSNSLDVSYGAIMLRLLNLSSKSGVTSQSNRIEEIKEEKCDSNKTLKASSGEKQPTDSIDSTAEMREGRDVTIPDSEGKKANGWYIPLFITIIIALLALTKGLFFEPRSEQQSGVIVIPADDGHGAGEHDDLDLSSPTEEL